MKTPLTVVPLLKGKMCKIQDAKGVFLAHDMSKEDAEEFVKRVNLYDSLVNELSDLLFSYRGEWTPHRQKPIEDLLNIVRPKQP